MNSGEMKPSVGVLLLDAQLRLIRHTAEAATILAYPRTARESVPLDAVLPATRSQLTSHSRVASGASLEFTSGRRRYGCRAYVLDTCSHASGAPGDHHQPKIVVILERVFRHPPDVTRWSEVFQLTSRECETVRYLLKGLSTREIAGKMSISPSTVKSFLKLVMVKVGAATRTGIIAKVHAELNDVAHFARDAELTERVGRRR